MESFGEALQNKWFSMCAKRNQKNVRILLASAKVNKIDTDRVRLVLERIKKNVAKTELNRVT